MPEPPPPFGVWAENWEAFVLFTNCATQWLYGPAGPVGLNYAGIESAMRLHGVKDRRRCFEKLQILEASALKAMRMRSDH